MASAPEPLRDVIARHGLQASKALGQNFILDRQLLARIAAVPGPLDGATVYEVGPGPGGLTRALLDAGARVVAVELHPERVRHLRRRFGGAVTVVRADAADLRLPTRPFHVVASVPYAVTAPLLRRLTHPGSRLRSAHLVVQAQAATRWSSPAAPAAARWQRTFAVSVGVTVPRHAFRPAPMVDSRVLVLRRR